MRITHFINQLLFDRRNIDAAAGSFMLGDYKGSVRRRFGDRKSDVSKVGNGLPLILAVAAGALRAAFDNVTCDRSGSKFVPIISSPAELMHHRS